MNRNVIPYKIKHYTITFDHNRKMFLCAADKGYEASKSTIAAIKEAKEFWKSCGYTVMKKMRI